MKLKKTPRTKINRLPKRAQYDSGCVYDIIDEAIIGHLAFTNEMGAHSIPLPFWREGDNLFTHCSVQSRLNQLVEKQQQCCISFTLVDGLVLAKSAFHHSMNYRSVVVYGEFSKVEEDEDKLNAMHGFMNLFDESRWDKVRQPNQKELNATTVLKLPLTEAVAKIRTGPPADKKADWSIPVWAGVIPFYRTEGEPEQHRED